MTRAIRVQVSCAKHMIVRVDIPDRPLTPDDIDAIHAAAIAEAGMDEDDDVDVTIIDDLDEAEPPDQPPDVPESAWVQVGAHRYAATGAVIVREDGPRPVGRPSRAEWQVRDIGALLSLLSDCPACPDDPWFDGRYQPLLVGSALFEFGGYPLAVTRDAAGDVVSVVLPMCGDAGSCADYPELVTLSGRRAEVAP